ncbi:hypothetical protein BDW59DRAFT_72450 [Aspergillus cavernicola]|uniref:Fungal N-terminal domain-containing protein n=1 Tax=Aspergillus cavernicola TaxID=176166 RepID=A0ABR4IET6_9EURO
MYSAIDTVTTMIMADPISIIGTIGALSNIADMVDKALVGIEALWHAWKEADLFFLSLVSQLIALRAALIKNTRAGWESHESSHYQLVMDLDVSISCCDKLVSKVEEFVSALCYADGESLDFRDRIMFLSGSKDLDNVQRWIQQQTSALNLLLAACNW